ncbi:hypothetical protein B0H14DRAFT_3663264 [Mycena olivaceomarginata]|nr:hypothetical protein B0H14DRAFT_3663264 [Mycena olivaceomarginata]
MSILRATISPKSYVGDEVVTWGGHSYGCNELIFNPLKDWWHMGPITKQLHASVTAFLTAPGATTIFTIIKTFLPFRGLSLAHHPLSRETLRSGPRREADPLDPSRVINFIDKPLILTIFASPSPSL